jgi:hypothetical protein
MRASAVLLLSIFLLALTPRGRGRGTGSSSYKNPTESRIRRQGKPHWHHPTPDRAEQHQPRARPDIRPSGGTGQAKDPAPSEPLAIRKTTVSADKAEHQARRHHFWQWLHVATYKGRLVVRQGPQWTGRGIQRYPAVIGAKGERALKVILKGRSLYGHAVILDAAVAADVQGVDLSFASSVHILTEDGEQLLPAHSWKSPQGQTCFDAEVAPHLTLGLSNAPGLLHDFMRLGKMSFDADDLRVTLLLEHTATRDELETRFGDRFLPMQAPTLDSLRQVFRQSRGRLLVVVAHHEDGNLVWRDARGALIQSFPIEEVHKLARETRTKIFLVACEIARVTGSGPVKEVDSLELVNQLERASQARNYRQFFEHAASPELPMRLSASATAGACDVYQESVQRQNVRMMGVMILGDVLFVIAYVVLGDDDDDGDD